MILKRGNTCNFSANGSALIHCSIGSGLVSAFRGVVSDRTWTNTIGVDAIVFLACWTCMHTLYCGCSAQGH